MKAIPNDFGFGGIGLTDWLPAVIRGLLAPTVIVVDGAAADTDITVAGLTASSHVISCVSFASGAPTVETATVQTNGKLQCAADTTGAKLLVTFIA